MKLLLPLLSFSFVMVFSGLAQAEPDGAAAVRTPADGPFIPEAGLAGGLVVPLYRPDSPFVKTERIHEAERYNTSSKNAEGKVLSTLNIHYPTMEVHLAPADQTNTGAAIIVAPGGGHKILWVGPEGYDLVPVFAKVGVSTTCCGIGCGWMGMSRRRTR